MKFKKMMLGLNLAILPIVSITTVISCSGDDKKPVTPTEKVEKTIADLQTEITNKTADIKIALSGKTSELTIDKVRSVLKDKLDDSFNALIDGLTLVNKVDAKVIVKYGRTDITITTSTNTPAIPKTISDLQIEITKKADNIKTALSGETSKMTIEKIKTSLKAIVGDPSFNALIDGLTLDSKVDEKVIVKSGKTKVTIGTSTSTPKTINQLTKLIENKATDIKTALSGETSKMTIEKIRTSLKAIVGDPSFNALIDGLTLDSKVDEKVIVKSGETKVTIGTSTSTPKTIGELKKAIKDNKEAISNELSGITSEMNLDKIQVALLKNIKGDEFRNLINKLKLKTKLDGSVIVTLNDEEITITTSTSSLKTLTQLQTAISNNKEGLRNELNGKTADMKLYKIKTALKKFLDQSFVATIDKLEKVSIIDGKATLKLGEKTLIIITSTSDAKTLEDLKNAIKNREANIANDLDGLTSEMTIDKVREVLKGIINDESFNDLIDKLTLTSKAEEEVTLKLEEVKFKVKTSTIAPRTVSDLEKEIKDSEEEIKTALDGKTSDLKIDKIKQKIKDNMIDGTFESLINNLELVSKKQGEVTLKLGTVEFKVKTSTT